MTWTCTEYVEFKELIGKTLTKVENDANQELIFYTSDGFKYTQYHDQNCCETVSIDDICGDLSDLVGSPILVAEEATQAGESSDYGYSSTWTFYKIATIKGHVDIKWYGSSNGYYSESVSLKKENHEA